MDKTSVTIILNDCYESEDKMAFITLKDGATFSIYKKPEFFNLMFSVEACFNSGEDDICEKIYIPYESILYISIGRVEDIKKMIMNEELSK